jgi:hypothetical protein
MGSSATAVSTPGEGLGSVSCRGGEQRRGREGARRGWASSTRGCRGTGARGKMNRGKIQGGAAGGHES